MESLQHQTGLADRRHGRWSEVRREDVGDLQLPILLPGTALQDECEAGETEKPSLSSSKALVIGDNQIRYLNMVFCARDGTQRLLACFPGAGIWNSGDRLGSVLAG